MKALLYILLAFGWQSIQKAHAAKGIDIALVRYPGTLEAVKEHRRLRVLTTSNSFNFYVSHGQQGGYEYDMSRRFVEYLNRRFGYYKRKEKAIVLEMIPVRHHQLIPMLQEGYGDMIAAGMTVTPERSRQLAFSVPYNQTSEVLVHNQGTKNLLSRTQLAGQKIVVRDASSYFESMVNFNHMLKQQDMPPVEIISAHQDLGIDSLLELVALDRFEFTLADLHVAKVAAEVFPNLLVREDLVFRSDSQISWATLLDSTDLLQEMNRFLPKIKRGTLFGNLNFQEHFENGGKLGLTPDQLSTKRISPYDSQIKKYAEKYGWDWRLLAALAYQESRFNPSASNPSGATGLFQIKPFVAAEPYVAISPVKGKRYLENNIHAGIKYLRWLKDTYFSQEDQNLATNDAVFLTLAAYNAGPNRLLQARRLAERLNLDPQKWDKNVEYALLAMRRDEPVDYVRHIRQRYQAYVMLGIE